MSPVFSAQANSVRVGAPPVLEVNHIEKVYGSRGAVTRALNDVSFIVETGEFVGIMGASGSGKSTLLNCVSTIDAVTSGGIFVDGQDVTKIKNAKLAKFRREQLGFIFQDSNLLDTLTARENIALPLTIGVFLLTRRSCACRRWLHASISPMYWINTPSSFPVANSSVWLLRALW